MQYVYIWHFNYYIITFILKYKASKLHQPITNMIATSTTTDNKTTTTITTNNNSSEINEDVPIMYNTKANLRVKLKPLQKQRSISFLQNHTAPTEGIIASIYIYMIL